TADKISVAHGDSWADVFGLQTNNFFREAVSLTPVTLYGPWTLPVRNRGIPDGLCASKLSRRTGCHIFCSCVGRSMNVNPTSWGPAVTLIRGEVIRLSISSREMVMFFELDS